VRVRLRRQRAATPGPEIAPTPAREAGGTPGFSDVVACDNIVTWSPIGAHCSMCDYEIEHASDGRARCGCGEPEPFKVRPPTWLPPCPPEAPLEPPPHDRLCGCRVCERERLRVRPAGWGREFHV
jgi:hypothetical protein